MQSSEAIIDGSEISSVDFDSMLVAFICLILLQLPLQSVPVSYSNDYIEIPACSGTWSAIVPNSLRDSLPHFRGGNLCLELMAIEANAAKSPVPSAIRISPVEQPTTLLTDIQYQQMLKDIPDFDQLLQPQSVLPLPPIKSQTKPGPSSNPRPALGKSDVASETRPKLGASSNNSTVLANDPVPSSVSGRLPDFSSSPGPSASGYSSNQGVVPQSVLAPIYPVNQPKSLRPQQPVPTTTPPVTTPKPPVPPQSPVPPQPPKPPATPRNEFIEPPKPPVPPPQNQSITTSKPPQKPSVPQTPSVPQKPSAPSVTTSFPTSAPGLSRANASAYPASPPGRSPVITTARPPLPPKPLAPNKTEALNGTRGGIPSPNKTQPAAHIQSKGRNQTRAPPLNQTKSSTKSPIPGKLPTNATQAEGVNKTVQGYATSIGIPPPTGSETLLNRSSVFTPDGSSNSFNVSNVTAAVVPEQKGIAPMTQSTGSNSAWIAIWIWIGCGLCVMTTIGALAAYCVVAKKKRKQEQEDNHVLPYKNLRRFPLAQEVPIQMKRDTRSSEAAITTIEVH